MDTLLKPSYDLLKGAEQTGVKEYNLAFVSPGGGCEPKWGGRQALDANPVARQVTALRAKGGDVRVSFGGQSGNELARVCGSVPKLVNAYRKVIDAYDLTKVDFDIEGPALTDTKANSLRARAIARLQRQHKDLDVSVTLPVLPSGLNRHAVAVLENAKKNGARISGVNIMAMDYGTYYDGDMGKYAIAAATATHKQVKSALGIRSEAQAWKAVSVTPMIGVNDVKAEVFRPDDAAELKRFAEKKGLGQALDVVGHPRQGLPRRRETHGDGDLFQHRQVGERVRARLHRLSTGAARIRVTALRSPGGSEARSAGWRRRIHADLRASRLCTPRVPRSPARAPQGARRLRAGRARSGTALAPRRRGLPRSRCGPAGNGCPSPAGRSGVQ